MMTKTFSTGSNSSSMLFFCLNSSTLSLPGSSFPQELIYYKIASVYHCIILIYDGVDRTNTYLICNELFLAFWSPQNLSLRCSYLWFILALFRDRLINYVGEVKTLLCLFQRQSLGSHFICIHSHHASTDDIISCHILLAPLFMLHVVVQIQLF